MMMRSLCLLTVVFLAAGWVPAMAEPAWVTDRVMADVFAEPDADSDRVATIMSGDAVELLEGSEGNYVRIRTDGGVDGWIEAGYVSMDPPAGQQLESLESERDELAEQVSTLETELESAREELDAVRRQGGNQQQQLSQARNRAAAAEQELTTYRSRAEEAEARVASLEEELAAANAAAEEEPDELVVFLPAFEPSASEANNTPEATEPSSGEPRQARMLPLFTLVGVVALLAGFGGYRLRERQLRKRLGGLSL